MCFCVEFVESVSLSVCQDTMRFFINLFSIFSRTARGDNKGTALSFVSVKEMTLLEEVERELAGSAEGGDTVFKPYQFRMEEIEGFKYRAKVY